MLASVAAEARSMGRQKSEPFWQHHVEAWRASDLTQEQYGRRHGLSA
ncbi:IS66 family insertion sequence element accessory protein TnpA, partial [Tahibacter caeni]